jgi:hypothetical protein
MTMSPMTVGGATNNIVVSSKSSPYSLRRLFFFRGRWLFVLPFGRRLLGGGALAMPLPLLVEEDGGGGGGGGDGLIVVVLCLALLTAAVRRAAALE